MNGLVKLNIENMFNSVIELPVSNSYDKSISTIFYLDNSIWMINDELGLLEIKNGTTTTYKPFEGDSLQNEFHGIEKVNNDQFIIATTKGLQFFNFKTKIFTTFLHKEKSVTKFIDNTIDFIIHLEQNKFLISSHNKGLLILDVVTNEYELVAVNKSKNIKAFLHAAKSQHGLIWMIERNRSQVHIFDIKNYHTTQLVLPKRNKDYKIYSINEDKEGLLWIGTDFGTLTYNPITRKFNNYSELNMASIKYQGENDAIILASTNKTLHLYNKKLKVWMVPDLFAKAGFRFIKSNFIKDKDGIWYAHFDDYLLGFDLNNINSKKRDLRPVISMVKIQDSILPISQLSQIELAYNQNDIFFRFCDLSFSYNKQKVFSCKLEGLDNQWIDCGTSPEITYSAIPPGDYKLWVKMGDGFGYWYKEQMLLQIKI